LLKDRIDYFSLKILVIGTKAIGATPTCLWLCTAITITALQWPVIESCTAAFELPVKWLSSEKAVKLTGQHIYLQHAILQLELAIYTACFLVGNIYCVCVYKVPYCKYASCLPSCTDLTLTHNTHTHTHTHTLELELEASHPKDDAVQGCGHTY